MGNFVHGLLDHQHATRTTSLTAMETSAEASRGSTGPSSAGDEFQLAFCSLRSAGEIARAGRRPSLLLFEVLRVTEKESVSFYSH